MATIQVGTANGSGISAGGTLPAKLSLLTPPSAYASAWVLTPDETGGVYSSKTISGDLTWQVRFTLGASDTIDGIEYKFESYTGVAERFTATELAIPFDEFNASLDDIMPLVTAAEDVITGNYNQNNLYGGTSNDSLYGTIGDDSLSGGDGVDYLAGGRDNDVLFGEAGNDELVGDHGVDALYGGEDDDTLAPGTRTVATNLKQIVDGGNGLDIITFEEFTDDLEINLAAGFAKYSDDTIPRPGEPTGNPVVDVIWDVEVAKGGTGNDLLIGNDGENQLMGNDGNDRYWALGGADVVYAGSGDDFIDGGDSDDWLLGEAGNDGVFGGSGDDGLSGNAGNDYVNGGEGDDSFYAEAGEDFAEGGAGNDTFYTAGGDGDDAYILGAGNDKLFFSYGAGRDTVFDFGDGQDVIDFSNTDMTLAVLQANAWNTSEGMVLALGSGSILLAGVDESEIDWQADFAFTPVEASTEPVAA